GGWRAGSGGPGGAPPERRRAAPNLPEGPRMVLTLGCVAVSLGSLVLAGLPACWLLNGRRRLREEDYLLAPFLGLAVLVLVLQNLVLLNVPVGRSAPFLSAG